MRVGIVGAGGVGMTLALELESNRAVSSLVLLDRSRKPLAAARALLGRVEADYVHGDAARKAVLMRAIRDCDVVVNASLPIRNLGIMSAALAAGVDYLDVAATGPLRPGGLPGILEQLRLHDQFRDAGRRALLSMGLDPGMSNVMAREASDRLDVVDEIRIRSGGTVSIRDHGRFPSFVPLYSRDAFFSDMRIRPTVWQAGQLEERELLSEEEEYDFPAPVGTQRTYLVAHEEVKTLPRFLGKPVRRVDFKYAINPDLANALKALENLGVLTDRHKISVDRRKVSFRSVFESVFPEPATVATRLTGTKCLTVDVLGLKGGVPKLIRENIALSHQEAARRRRTTAVYYLTAVAAAIGVDLLTRRGLPSAGVYPSEILDPGRVFEAWALRGLTIGREERSVPN